MEDGGQDRPRYGKAMKRLSRAILLAALVALVASGCSKRQEKQAEEAPPQVREHEQTGEEIFNERCRDCHKVGDKGGPAGPDLSAEGSKRDRDYLVRVIREPAKLYPGTIMPPGDRLTAKQIDLLADYLQDLK
ncbi:hypothetical protein GMSM_13480 [Geomonas sp. Red276]